MRLALSLFVLAAVACSKPSSEGPSPAGSTASASSGGAAASASGATASPAASTAAGASASPGGSSGVASSSWSGAYKSAASAITVTPAWKKIHWSDTQSTQGVGDGTMTLAVDGATGRVSGTIDGPLGPALLDGAVTDGKVAATLVRKVPTDQGFTGTLLGTMASGKVEGTMNVSLGGGGTVRTATFTLAPTAPR